MMQSELLEPNWPLYNIPNAYSSHDPTGRYGFPMDINMGDADYSDFSSSFSNQDSSSISRDTIFASTTPASLVDFPTFSVDKEIIKSFPGECKWMDESDSEGNLCSELTSSEGADAWNPPEHNRPMLFPADLRLPGNNMETDSQVVLRHLLVAYGEAMENDQKQLMEVVVKRVNDRIDPLRNPMERLASKLFQSAENASGYLRQQSSKNFEAAYKVFYQWFPYGRFAHFTANSAILEAIPKDVEMIHIVDFDIGDGIQWPPVIEAIGRLGKALRLTSIKPDAECRSGEWNFEDTKFRLHDHARSLGLSLRVEEMSLGELTTEIKRKTERSGGREWLAFNCTVGLPHMGRRRNRSDVVEFVRIAKESSAHAARGRGREGILTFGFGGGETGEDLEKDPRYAGFFNSQLTHYQALLESMEGSNFPIYLTEARLAMESLFVWPNICSLSWLQRWKDSRKGQVVTGWDGKRISQESLAEAKEIVNKKESSYEVKMQGEMGNELVLEWKGTPLVRVGCWM